MSDDVKPADGAIPPKLNLKKSTDTDATPQKTQPAAPSAMKKQTARIELASALPEGAPAESVPSLTTKTIRLTPLSAARPMTVKPATMPQKTVSAAALAEQAKQQTSRIPLEAALADEKAGAGGIGSGSPKTIRIKRPAQGPVGKLPTPPAAGVVDAAAQKSKTARVDAAAEAQPTDAGQATQRKTIKIRRAEGGGMRPVPRSMAVARLEAEAAERQAENVEAPGAIFTILSAVALVVLCVMIYVLMVQAMPQLGWNFPGKVTL